jgi:hypothetical protein
MWGNLIKSSFIITTLLILPLHSFEKNTETIDHWETVVDASETWSYFEGYSPLPNNWVSIGFDDSTWKKGEGGLGYGDNDDKTTIEQANSLFIRKKFKLFSTQNIVAVYFHIDYDDGFVAYLNGIEIARSLMADVFPAYNTLSTDQHEAQMYQGGKPEQFIIGDSIWKKVLVEGENILAIQIHNSSTTSSDMSAIPFLTLGITDNSRHYRNTPPWFDAPFVFNSSNLPIIIIETKDGEQIKDESKVPANMKIINNGAGKINHINDTPTDYDGNIGVEIRGAYSASLPQKPYGIETRDSLGANDNVSLLGMPKENDWILLANYNDKSFMRNTLAFHLFEKMGHYAPRTKACEVIVNGDYQGIYIFTERIKVDKHRVNIAKLDADDNAGDSLTGGYIFKIDYPDGYSWESKFSPLDRPNGKVFFVNHDPAGDEITEEQQNYLKWFVNQFESSLYGADFKNPVTGYRSFIDVETFIDYFIMGEISRNVDAYKKSRYLYKEKDSKGGLLCSGPVWDYDWAWKNMDDCWFLRGQDGSGWAYKINECDVWPTPPAWIVRFLEDPLFVDQLYTRYTNLRETILSEEYIGNYADSVETLLNEAQARHFARWPILGERVGAPENDFIPTTYKGEVEKLVNWINVRLSWLDANIEGRYITADTEPSLKREIILYPNPARNFISVKTTENISSVVIYDFTGNKLFNLDHDDLFANQINVASLKNGIYIMQIWLNNQQCIVRKFEVEN